MSLLAGIGEALRDALGPEADVFPPATLHVAVETLDASGQGVRSFADHQTVGFVSSWDHKTLAAKGWDPKTARIVIVQGLAPAPKIGDELTAARPINETTARYRVISVSSDPADATWALAGVPV